MSTSSPPFRVLIVEDDAPTRDYFVQSVFQHPQLELLAQAASLAQGLQALKTALAQGAAPDVLLTDLGLPDGSGLEMIRAVTALVPSCDSLVISMFGDEDNVLASIEAGATGYIHKDSSPHDVAASILQLKAGASPISPMIARRLLSKYRDIRQSEHQKTASEAQNSSFLDANKPKTSVETAGTAPKLVASTSTPTKANEAPTEPPGKSILSKREIDILDHLARGFSYAELAKLKFLSVHTIQSHIKNIYAKLSVHNRAEAVYEASKLGILKT